MMNRLGTLLNKKSLKKSGGGVPAVTSNNDDGY